MIRGCAAGAGFALILAEPKAGPGAEPMLRVTLPAGQSHRLTSSGKAEFNIAYDFLCKATSDGRAAIKGSQENKKVCTCYTEHTEVAQRSQIWTYRLNGNAVCRYF